MQEPEELIEARARLAQADAAFGSPDGLMHLALALALLDTLVDSTPSRAARSVALNLGATHARAVYRRLSGMLQSERAIPAPVLEHSFRVIRVLDDRCFELPAESRTVKVDVVRRLVDLYYEGHSQEQKQRILDELTGLAGE